MPTAHVHLIAGYGPRVKQRLCRVLTHSMRGVLGADPAGISVWLHQVEPHDYMRAGQSRRPGKTSDVPPEDVVSSFLAAMEQRDLKTARDFLAPGFIMTFPGSGELHDLEELVAWSAGRYRFVRKDIAALDVAYGETSVVVTVSGTLSGEWPDGQAFSGVRFIDRFVLENNRLKRQDVWNDLALKDT